VSTSTVVRLTRRYRFEAAHRLYAPSLGAEENWAIFGKCSREGGHGHNYEFEVTFEGEPDPRTGLVVIREDVDREVRARILDRCDHRDLNDVITDRVTTGENIARVFFAWLEPAFPTGARLVRVRVFETARNVFDATSA
jgi:6-pyruvoyltetrahydropterin/6-carboxytetrahydropterin synthase